MPLAVRSLLINAWSSKAFGWRILRILVVFLVAMVTLVMIFEDKLVYLPTKYPDGGRWEESAVPAREGQIFARIEDCYFQSSDGKRLNGWYGSPFKRAGAIDVPLESPAVLLFFHGNAGNIAGRREVINLLAHLPADVFMIDYRGYGRSEGKPSEAGLYQDATAAWDYLTAGRGVDPARIIIFGESLGGAIAIDLATRKQAAGLIVQSTFTSIPDMASDLLPFFPRFILHNRMDSLRKITQVNCPKLFIHSPADEVVPYSLGRKLAAAAAEPKTFCEVPGARHNETFFVAGPPYYDQLRAFIRSVTTLPK